MIRQMVAVPLFSLADFPDTDENRTVPERMLSGRGLQGKGRQPADIGGCARRINGRVY